MTDATRSQLIANLLPTLKVLEEYDKGAITINYKTMEKQKIDFLDIELGIEITRDILREAGQDVEFFGVQKDESLSGIISNLYQTYDQKEVYPYFEDKAAHLLYFVIKDHPFIDGNKRLGISFFAYYLEINGFKLNGNAQNLSTLALHVAQSKADQKELIINLIIHFIQNL